MRRLAVIVLGVLAFLLPGLPAQAELYSNADDVQDVQGWSPAFCDGMDGPPIGSCAWPDPLITTASGDILRTNIRHQRSTVLFRIKERGVDARGQRSHNIVIVTNEGVRRTVRFTAVPGVMQPRSVVMRKPSGTPVSCRGLWAGMDPNTDLVTLIVPRRCLSYPRWIRAGVSSEGRWIACPLALHQPDNDYCVKSGSVLILGSAVTAEDDAFDELYDAREDRALSPRIYRG